MKKMQKVVSLLLILAALAPLLPTPGYAIGTLELLDDDIAVVPETVPETTSEVTQAPTTETIPSTAETEPPTEETVPPTTETVPPTEETVPPTTETVPPTEETVPPTVETEPPTEETQPPLPEVSWHYSSEDKILYITGYGPMDDFGYNGQPWKKHLGKIETIVISDGVTSIGAYAFAHCTKLTHITIPKSVTSIGKFAFYCCRALPKISLPSGLTSISTALFYGCSALKKISVPQGVTTIASYAFEKCTSLSSVTLPSTVTTIGNTTFASCTSLTAIDLPTSLTKLGGGAFYGCSSLAAITLPRSITQIADHTFYECSALTSICIPDQVTLVDYYAFYGCSKLTNISFTGDAPAIDDHAFSGVIAYASYSPDNATWSSDMLAGYGGRLTWGGTLRIVAGRRPATGKPQLQWTALPDAVSYQIYRSTRKNSGFNRIYTTKGTSFTNTSPEPGDVYYYKVNVLFKNGCSAFSDTFKCSCTLPRPVVTISNVASTGKVRLTWDKIPGAQKYEVYRATSKYGGYTRIFTTTGTKFTNTSSKPGKTYYYQVRAIHANSACSSSFSVIRSRMCDLPQPVVTAKNDAATGKIKLTWNKVDGAEGYTVYRATSKNGTYYKMKTVTGTTYTNTSAKTGKMYYYKVQALHSKANAASAESAVVSRTCDLARPVVKLTLNAKGKPKLTWESVDGAESYEVYRATSKNGTYTKMLTTSGTKCTHTKAIRGTKYYYRVKAIHSNAKANSAYSVKLSIQAG